LPCACVDQGSVEACRRRDKERASAGQPQHGYAEPSTDLACKPEATLSDEIRQEPAGVAASSWGADQALERVRVELAERLTRSRRLRKTMAVGGPSGLRRKSDNS
jgi:hypothetical protein